MYLPEQFTSTAPAGTFRLVPTATIFPSFVSRVALVSVVMPSLTMVALVNAYCPCLGSLIPFSGNVDCDKAIFENSIMPQANNRLLAFLMCNKFFLCKSIFRRGLKIKTFYIQHVNQP